MYILLFIIIGLLCLAVYDISQPKHTIWHNYPIIGHLRNCLESIGGEIRQYFIENNREGLPFNRSQRTYRTKSIDRINYYRYLYEKPPGNNE